MGDGVVTSKLSGFDELGRRLSEEPPKVARKVLRNAGSKGGEIIRSAIAARAPHDEGFLEDHIAMKVTVNASKGTLVVVIGPQANAGYFKGATRHGDKVEFQGSMHLAEVAARMAELGSKHQPARPFMGPAFESSSDEALDVFIDELWNGCRDLEEK